ncbi:CoA transferase [Streptomyces kanasensis]|uniref:CoA transferase n=1 Tax=Streptomyces kanasensis TaxID=936756 RepID=UPI0036FACF72
MNRAMSSTWAALGADPEMPQRVAYHRVPGLLPSRLPVAELARTTVAVCALAAAELAAARGGGAVPRVAVDDAAVAAAFHSERHVALDGRSGGGFAPLSRFWRTADGWVRTHANYPHHRDRLLTALGLPAGADGEAVADALAGRRAVEVEEAVYAAGGLAVAVRDADTWAAGQGAPLAGRPVLDLERTGDAPGPAAGVPSAGADAPCAGIRVLDLTRVLAGPVATRTLSLLGADVLRVDAPELPESQEAHDDTGNGKRSALLDLRRAADRRTFEELLSTADVVVTGYRPGALDRFGLAPAALAERRPGLVVARLSAWGGSGPWGGRRGFDSLVQAATGIALTEGGGTEPGVLPAQALDHGTGYLVAAAVLRALTERHRAGGTWRVEATLTRTAHLLTHGTDREDPAPGASPTAGGSAAPAPGLLERDTPRGRLRYAPSPVSYEGGPRDWTRPPGRWGADAPRWTT